MPQLDGPMIHQTNKISVNTNKNQLQAADAYNPLAVVGFLPTSYSASII